MVGEVVDEETTELEEEAAMRAWVASLLGEAMVEEVKWCRRHLQDTTSDHRVSGEGHWFGQGHQLGKGQQLEQEQQWGQELEFVDWISM